MIPYPASASLCLFGHHKFLYLPGWSVPFSFHLLSNRNVLLAKFWTRAEEECSREGKCACLMLRTSTAADLVPFQPQVQGHLHPGATKSSQHCHGKCGSGSHWDNEFPSPSRCEGRSSLAGSTGRATGSPEPCSHSSCSILHPLIGNSAHFGNTQTNCSGPTLLLPSISQLPGPALQPEVLAVGMWPLNSKPGFAPQLITSNTKSMVPLFHHAQQ